MRGKHSFVRIVGRLPFCSDAPSQTDVLEGNMQKLPFVCPSRGYDNETGIIRLAGLSSHLRAGKHDTQVINQRGKRRHDRMINQPAMAPLEL